MPIASRPSPRRLPPAARSGAERSVDQAHGVLDPPALLAVDEPETVEPVLPAPKPAASPPPARRTPPPSAAVPVTDSVTIGNTPSQDPDPGRQLDHLNQQIEEIQRHLRHAQKLASLGTTAAMVAHELNNLLTPVVGYAREALRHEDLELMRKALTKTLDRADAMQAMIARITGLARPSSGAIEPVRVRAIAEEAIACLGRELSKDGITVTLRIADDLAVQAVPGLLLQVIFNLVANARQAMLGRAGRLTVEAAGEPDGRVRIDVRDTGKGIPADDLARIFEPFFSTKSQADRPDQGGLGLGLPISRDIISELDGSLTVLSEPGAGSTFTILLPAAR